MLAGTTEWMERIFAPGQSHAVEPEVRAVEPGELLSLPRDGRTLRVVSGEAWLAMAGRDHILAPGDEVSLAKGSERALLSSLDGSGARIYLS